MSYPFLRRNSSFLSSLSIVRYYGNHISKSTIRPTKKQSCYPQLKHIRWVSADFSSNKLEGPIQTTCRTISTRFSLFQNEIAKPLDIQSETQTSGTNWFVASKGRDFVQKEALFYHNVLACSSAYSGTIYKEDPQFLETYKINDIEYKSMVDTETWDGKSPYDIVTSFISLGVYASKQPNMTIEDKRFETLISALIENLSSCTDGQLIDCFIALKYWPLLSSLQDPQILKVWKKLDDVCFKRSLDWSIDKCLFMMDLWFHLGLLKRSYFVHKGLNKISRKTDEFTASQMIQSLLYISCKQNINHEIVVLREYEHYIQKYITKLSIEEIGIFALAFFKTKTNILNKKILIYLMQRTVEEAETSHSIVLSSIAKTVRFSHKPDIGFTANDMVTKLIEKRWDSLSLVTGIHLVHINTQIQFYNEESLIKLAEKFCKNPSVARLKEMERIAFFLSLYNFIPPSTPDVCQMIIEQLNSPLRQKEVDDHPLMSLSLLYFLSLLRVFPEKQIQQILNEEFLLSKYGNKFNIPQQTVQLDYNRVLEGPTGSEHLLSPRIREYLARRYSMFLPDNKNPKKSKFDQLMDQVIKLTDELLGKENNLATYTLPHFPRADILFRLDDNGNPLPIPEEMKSLSEFENVHRPTGPGKWYSVVIGGRNMYMHNIPRLVGEQTTKIRQLKSLGYTPIVIPSYYWNKEEDKLAYLKLKYFSSYEQNK